jgi:hypothetical protein
VGNKPVADLSDAEIRESLKARRTRVAAELAKLDAVIEAFDTEPAHRHKMDSKARQNISAAQKKRWATWRKAHGKKH